MLGLFRRRPKLPADRRPALAREERVLAWAITAAGQTVVVTNRGLWLPGLNRLGWHEIHKAVWSDQELRVTPARICEVHDGYAVVADQPVVSALLPDPGEVPHQVRTRVTRSVAASRSSFRNSPTPVRCRSTALRGRANGRLPKTRTHPIR